jgi:site-specific DNA-methyltransferase (adenine-specific)
MTEKQWAEGTRRLNINLNPNIEDIQVESLCAVGVVILPAHDALQFSVPFENLEKELRRLYDLFDSKSTFIVVGEDIDLFESVIWLQNISQYQLWISIKAMSIRKYHGRIPVGHFGAIVFTKYNGSLRHCKTRLPYSFCPTCDKTTKDYGGKKHTYNSYGTLLSDVWTDINADLSGELTDIYIRFADLFGIEQYNKMYVFDKRDSCFKYSNIKKKVAQTVHTTSDPQQEFKNTLLMGDCIEQIRLIPDNYVDFVFSDPPYNLKKKYAGYGDDLEIKDYFSWCDEWIKECLRVLKPGRTLALLNIPLWAVRHYLYLKENAYFQNSIVWDALSFPVRLIMPANYTILCFSKGKSRNLPGINKCSLNLRPLEINYCVREKCVHNRIKRNINDKAELLDIWWDIHRLKHNSRRVDHPCQLPPKLMYRLIELFTMEGEIVLDPFNGAGTTSLCANQLKRSYIGIELNEEYHNLANKRHKEIKEGINPFRKADRELTAKNSPVARVKKQTYEVPKKTLQLEVRRVTHLLNRIPSREELIQYGKYKIEYYDSYFVSWGEVTAAARTDGMVETRHKGSVNSSQAQLFEL